MGSPYNPDDLPEDKYLRGLAPLSLLKVLRAAVMGQKMGLEDALQFLEKELKVLDRLAEIYGNSLSDSADESLKLEVASLLKVNSLLVQTNRDLRAEVERVKLGQARDAMLEGKSA